MTTTTDKITLELAVEIGGYSNMMQAQQEAREFKLPSVFTRRSGVFPDPVDFDLQVVANEATAKAWVSPPSPLNQFYVDLRITVTGKEAKIRDWYKKVLAAVKIFHASSYGRRPGEAGERAEHLRFRAEEQARRAAEAAKTPAAKPARKRKKTDEA